MYRLTEFVQKPIEKNNDPVFAELVKQRVETGLATTANQSDFSGEALGTDYSDMAGEYSLYGTNYGRTPKGSVTVTEISNLNDDGTRTYDEQLSEELRKRMQILFLE